MKGADQEASSCFASLLEDLARHRQYGGMFSKSPVTRDVRRWLPHFVLGHLPPAGTLPVMGHTGPACLAKMC